MIGACQLLCGVGRFVAPSDGLCRGPLSAAVFVVPPCFSLEGCSCWARRLRVEAGRKSDDSSVGGTGHCGTD